MKTLKIRKKILSSVLAAGAAFSSATAPFLTAYAAEVTPTAYRQYAEDDNIIVFDASTAETVYVDTSDMEVVYLDSNARSQSLPYSGGITFPANINFAYTPLFVTDSLSNDSQLWFKPTKIKEGGHKFNITINLHYAGENSDKYHAINSGTRTMYAGTAYKLDLSTAANNIDNFFLEFTSVNDCATSFNYTIYIV